MRDFITWDYLPRDCTTALITLHLTNLKILYRSLLDDKPLNCPLPCAKVSYKVDRTEFQGYNRSYIANQVSSLFFADESTNIEVHEDYVLVNYSCKNVFFSTETKYLN
jgi:hypothetical protein